MYTGKATGITEIENIRRKGVHRIQKVIQLKVHSRYNSKAEGEVGR
jgi:hypothetical protein